MIITDLDRFEVVSETPHVLGGSGNFDYSTYVSQYAKIDQYSTARSDAESQFGDATALAVSYNAANIEQDL